MLVLPQAFEMANLENKERMRGMSSKGTKSITVDEIMKRSTHGSNYNSTLGRETDSMQYKQSK